MHTALWVIQGLLGGAFLMAGLFKATQPKEKLTEKMAWANDFSPATIKLIGVIELLGAIGIVLPTATRILPWLAPTAAIGLVVVMIGAAVVHVRRHEYLMIVPNVVLGGLAAFVAYGRLVAVPVG